MEWYRKTLAQGLAEPAISSRELRENRGVRYGTQPIHRQHP